MTIELHTIGDIRYYIEPSGSTSFAADNSANLSQFTYLPAREGSATMTLEQPGLDPMQMVQSRAEYREEVFGPRKATLTLTLNLAPTGLTTSGSILAATGSMGTVLKTFMGGEILARGTVFNGGTAVAPSVVSAAGLSGGCGVGWVNPSGTLEVREVKSITGNTLTLNYAFSQAPVGNLTCYAGATYFVTEDPQQSFQFLVEGVEAQDRWLLLGGQVTSVSQEIDVTGASLPGLTITFTFADWKASDETAGNITGALADAVYTNFNPIVGYEGVCQVTTVGTSTYSEANKLPVSAIDIQPKVSFVPVTSPSGKNTILRWRAGRLSPPVEGSFTPFFEDLTWFNHRKNSTDMALLYQLGTSPGACVCLSVPTIQILNPQRVANGEIAGQNPSFKARRNTDTALTTELAKSPYKIHIF